MRISVFIKMFQIISFIVAVLFLLKFGKIAQDVQHNEDYENKPDLEITKKTNSKFSLKSQAIERRKWLHIYDPIPYDFINNYYVTLVPEVRCPNLLRLGEVLDGGKWICNPQAAMLSDNCTVYSFGLRELIGYELDFMKITKSKCRMRAIDMNPPPEILKTVAEVMVTKVGENTTETTTSFTDILKHFGDTRLEILKIDIEGAEEEVMSQILAIPICQIIIEMHINNAPRTIGLLEQISFKGYYLYSTEQHPTLRHIREYSFIHENCLKQYEAKVLAKYIT